VRVVGKSGARGLGVSWFLIESIASRRVFSVPIPVRGLYAESAGAMDSVLGLKDEIEDEIKEMFCEV
jgi:hypothetical protein